MNHWLAVFLLLAVSPRAGAGEPLTDLPKAIERAKAEKKHVLVEFTGSDWCVPCIAFDRNVMTNAAFVAFVKDRLVLVRLDIPYRRKIDPDLKKRNEALAEQYRVKVYPTFVVLDGNGREIGRRESYLGEPAGEFVKIIRRLIRKDGKQ